MRHLGQRSLDCCVVVFMTERGLGLLRVQIAMAEFGYRHLLDDDKRLVDLIDRATGQRVTVGFVS